ncbi:hypothetical protein [Halocatena pleomorpha]|uniref:Rod shape-determining protein MreD n=1 Tax=Halocatena pleomorpha TaxID=1785090 RepID=A0A3P3R992_9EURY|nr:hypothetical protein [Halocatena pleomorpha]RRJ29499.1 hypothetical protein EIK79_12745 [Halocatena pleomorpha]
MLGNRFGLGQPYPTTKLIVIAGITAVLFVGGLLITERFGEYFVDVDFKPFFIVYVVLALVPWGRPTVAIGVGAALGEGFLDLIEGYEFDDPFGFVGYLVGFTVAGWFFRNDPTNRFKLATGAIVGAFVQASFEASAFVLIEREAMEAAFVSLIGNTITHGIILGIIPLFPCVTALYGRIERFLGFAPKGTNIEQIVERIE